MASYWVFDWLRENRLTSLEDVATFLPKYRVLDVLRQRAADFLGREAASRPPSERSIVAGMGLDLAGGGIVCASPSCLRGQVDKLMRHVWHYFDTVVVDDVLTSLLTDEYEGTRSELIHDILQQFPPLLYIEEIGAAELLDFRAKVRCSEHFEENAKAGGIGRLITEKKQLLKRLVERSKLRHLHDKGGAAYGIEFVDSDFGTLLPPTGLGEHQARRQAASFVLSEYLLNVVADVGASHQYQLPLGSAEAFVGEMLAMSQPTSADQAVFQIRLPILEKVPTAELIRIRRENIDSFDRFRNALRATAMERLRQDPEAGSVEIAEEIRRDILDPKIEEIRATLKAAEKLLLKKGSLGIFLGALATTCGLISGVPPSVAVSAGAATTLGVVGAASSKHLETTAEVSLQDMYFLWKAVGHPHGDAATNS
jgi:hypothetical protein